MPDDVATTAPTPRVYVRRRYALLGLLALLSATWWTGVWAWSESEARRQEAAGVADVAVTLHTYGFELQATWVYVWGLLGVHVIGLIVGGLRRDREALAGFGWSAVLHFAWLVSRGVIAP